MLLSIFTAFGHSKLIALLQIFATPKLSGPIIDGYKGFDDRLLALGLKFPYISKYSCEQTNNRLHGSYWCLQLQSEFDGICFRRNQQVYSKLYFFICCQLPILYVGVILVAD